MIILPAKKNQNNMKKIVLLALFFLASLQNDASVTTGIHQTIRMQFQYHDPHNEAHPLPRTPAKPITVSQNGHVFTFAEYLAGNIVELVSGDSVVYTSVIDDDGTITIPDNIVGEFELVLYLGDNVYNAEVELHNQ